MQVTESKLVAILKGLSVHNADSWGPGKLTARVNADGGLEKYTENGTIRPDDAELATLMDELIASQASESIEVVPDPATEGDGTFPLVPPEANGKPKAKAKKTPPKKKPESVPVSKMTWKEEKAHFAKHPLALPDEGHLAVTVEQLRAVGKTKIPKPVTKQQILAVLRKKYPDARAGSMETNLNNNVPGRLRWKYGIHVWRERLPDGKVGYYILGDGKKLQPKEEKTAKPKVKKEHVVVAKKPKSPSVNGKPKVKKKSVTATKKPKAVVKSKAKKKTAKK